MPNTGITMHVDTVMTVEVSVTVDVSDRVDQILLFWRTEEEKPGRAKVEYM